MAQIGEDAGSVLDRVRSAFDAFNRGDMTAFAEHWSPSVVAIINEAPPYAWTGDAALARWLADSGARVAAEDPPSRDRRIALKQCLKAEVEGDRAFLVLVVTVSATRGRQRVEEDGAQISRLRRMDGRWLIEALAYGGGLATRSAPA